jgi:alkanesulfonate monooxygenase SsuD/methylene tetrahydromethanopterin reductase-like flavin-dependent oxidoreductase (luciferase family)
VRDLIFGVNVSTSAASGADPVHDAQFAEELGFDFVSASDHPGSMHPTFEVWTMLTWIAAATTRIQVAPRVLGVPLRFPALIAKMAESLSRLSAGRLILGLGAGGSDEELRSYGARPGTPKEKIEGLEDAVRIIRGLWTSPGFTHSGQIHQTAAAQLEPKPAHPIPIWLGTFRPRGLALTGRLANGWIPTLGHVPADDLPPMRDRVLTAAREAGRDPADLRCVLNLEIALIGYGASDPDVVTGSPEEVAAQLAGFVRLGFSGFNLIAAGHAAAEQLHRISVEVLPAVRAAAE